MKRILLNTGLFALLACSAKALPPTIFQPGKLAVIQFGDGATNRCLPLGAVTGITNYSASDIFGSRQNQIFIDQFDPNGVNQTRPSVQVAIPTNGPGALLVNGNAGTEGNMTLSDDRSVLAFAGYAGDILSVTTGGQTAPSNLSYERGVATVDAFTNYTTVYRGNQWYGTATGKTNPRGVATDGNGKFWGCGNGYGSLYYDANSGNDPIQFQSIALTSCSKVINGVLYNTVKSSESVNLYPAGIYTCVDFFNNPANLPTSASFLHLYLQAQAPYTTCIGFDINPQQTIAYVADTTYGIQKYIRSGLSWKFAYNLAIPGYTNHISGTFTNAAQTNVLVGAFSVTADWSGPNPVLYATTSDCGNDNKDPYYGNRVIRINDTNTVQDGRIIIATTNILTTVAMPPTVNGLVVTNIVYKSVTFTPDLRPLITSNPTSWAAAAGDNVSFSVAATAKYDLSYQWLENGVAMNSQTAAVLNLNAVSLSSSNYNYQCVVSDFYGSVTSSAATLTVTATSMPPVIGTVQNLTNYIGNNVSITVNVTGTDVKGGYQWYFKGNPLSDANEYSGTATPTLSISQAALGDAGNYSVSVTNLAGSASNIVAVLTLVYAPPALVQPPQAFTTFVGRNITNAVSAYGQLLSYQWYQVKANGTSPVALGNAGDFSGVDTANLVITGVKTSESTNYVVVVTNPGGSITSAPALLTVATPPAHTFVSYTNQLYTQNFDSLPIPGGSSAEGGNPLTISYVITNLALITANPSTNYVLANNVANQFTYSMDNPFDFGYPVFTNGNIGGYGLASKMAGWYGWCQKSMVISATRGDQTQGAIVDNGMNYLGDGTSIAGVTNRALGLVATSKTGVNAFALALVNTSTNTYTTINLSYLGELWHNVPKQQVLYFGYSIDSTANSTFSPGLSDGTSIDSLNGNTLYSVTNLNVMFATNNDTISVWPLTANQVTSIGVTNLAITNWPPNTTLWLVWQADTLGSAQNVAIDNLSFSASVGPVTAPQLSVVSYRGGATGTGLKLGFSNVVGAAGQFTVWGSTNVNLPFSQWSNLGHPAEVSSGTYQFTDAQATNKPARFYKVTSP